MEHYNYGELVQFLYDEMSGVNHFKISPSLPVKNRSGIVYLVMDEYLSITEEDFARMGIRLHVSGNKVSLGLHFYNSLEDVKKLISVLKGLNGAIDELSNL